MNYVVAAISATASYIGLRAIIKDNRLFDPPDLDGRIPPVSKWGR
jgi:hypothetical protein